MAYMPTHKRYSKITRKSSPPKPELLSPNFNQNNLKFQSTRTTNFSAQRISKFVYTDQTIYKWFTVGFDDADGNEDRRKFPSSVRLQPVFFKSIARKVGEKSLALISNNLAEEKESSGVRVKVLRSPWVYIADNVVKDLLTSFERARNEMWLSKREEPRPTLVARFGKVIFIRHSSFNQEESVTEDLACEEETLRQMRRAFNTSIPKSYMDYILKEGTQKIGVAFEDTKDVYRVTLSDSTRPDLIISCKCRMLKGRKLELYKIKLNQARHMVMDISCLDKNVDLRLMLRTKRTIASLTDDDRKNIRDLIDSAVLDAKVKGGLRWSSGKSRSRDRFCVTGVWHTSTKSYVNQSMRLKVRNADRFNFNRSSGEVSREIIIHLKRLAKELKKQNVDESAVKQMLKDDLMVLWDNFFCCESILQW